MRIDAALPYPFEFPRVGTALMLIDLQRDFLEPGGFGAALGNNVSLLASCLEPAQSLLAAFRSARLPVIHTKEAHRPDLSDCPPAKRRRGNARLRIGDPGPMGRILIAGEPGNDIVSAVYPRAGELVLEKPGKGAFTRTDLEQRLIANGISHLVIGGVTTEVCVQTTMREANDRGFECLLVEDATASYFPEFKRAAVEMVRAQGGIVGWTATAAQVVAAVEGGAP